MNHLLNSIIEAGKHGGWALALVVACAAVALVYIRPVGEIPATTSEKVVPATGEQGFNTAVFCDDSATTVTELPSPDASGITYELKRVKDGTTETVVVVWNQAGDITYAKHFWDTPTGQESEPAFVTEKARSCIEDK
jgi:hypothetical protein